MTGLDAPHELRPPCAARWSALDHAGSVTAAEQLALHDRRRLHLAAGPYHPDLTLAWPTHTTATH